MKTYKIANLEIDSAEYLEGYNVYEYFEAPRIDERHFATAEAASEFANANYKGADEYGVGVTWSIEEDDSEWELETEDHDILRAATPEEVEESTNASAEGWIEAAGVRCFAQKNG